MVGTPPFADDLNTAAKSCSGCTAFARVRPALFAANLTDFQELAQVLHLPQRAAVQKTEDRLHFVVSKMIALLLFAVAAIAQQSPVTEKIEVSVVNVDVAVTGADGQPVRGLSAADFEIFDDGRRQAITNFYVVEKGVEAGPSAGQYRPEGRYPHDAFRRKVLVLVDVFHTTKNRR